MKTPRLSFLPGLAAFLLTAPLLPAQMNYQGRLTGPAGAPLPDANATVVFHIYDAPTGGTPTWGPFTATVPLTDGRFNVILGPNDTNGTPRNIINAFGTGARYLGIKVGTANEITPRQQILDAPTALMAQRIPNVWTSGANVGIGNQAPGAPLEIAANSSTLPNANGLVVYNPANTAGNNAIISARVAGSAGGNPFVSWDVNGEIGYSMGIDNADNKLKIAQAWDNVNSSTRMTFDTNGRVGIGTTAPRQMLHVNGDYYGKGHLWFHANEGDGNSGTAYLQARDSSTTSTVSMQLRTKNGNAITEALLLSPTGHMTVPGGATISGGATINQGMVVNGRIGMNGVQYSNVSCTVSSLPGIPTAFVAEYQGTSNFIRAIDYGFEVSYGNAYKPGGGAWGSYSDARLKKDVRDLAGALNKLGQLHSVTFDYKQPEKFGVKGRQTGFIAQEVEKVFPEWIAEIQAPGKTGDAAVPAEKYKTVNITGFESLTVQALRELRAEKDAQIKTLAAENTTLRDTVKAQEARLAKLEQAVTALAAAEGKPAKTTAKR